MPVVLTTCDCCCERTARHLLYSNGIETKQCCKCYVEAGGPPADGHVECMRAFETSPLTNAASATESCDRLNEAPHLSLEEFHALLRDAQKEVDDDFVQQFVVPMREWRAKEFRSFSK